MKNRILANAFILAVLFSGLLVVQAGAFGPHHPRGGMFHLKAFMALDLSDSQKSEIKNILDNCKEERNARVDRFFTKMKTKVADDPELDLKELELSYNNPRRFDHMKILPRSAWEFDKWDKEDFVGFSLSMVGVFAVIGLLILFITIGS